MRPIYHRLEHRVQAHILVCFLALALWRTLEQWMQAKGLGTFARQLVKDIAGIKSVDVIVPVRRAGLTTKLRLRVVTTPEPAAAQLFAHLGLRLPQGSRLVSDVVPKIGVRNRQTAEYEYTKFLNCGTRVRGRPADKNNSRRTRSHDPLVTPSRFGSVAA
ncbi:MAG: hypothetical protein PSV13_15735 [Lacunisphaera sp.]|nr:hypothetical protein [Lacunisphaera sp.]